MWSAIEEFRCDVLHKKPHQGVIAHPEGILVAVAVRIPSVDGGRRAHIWRNEGGDREDAMAIVAAACGQRRSHGMPQSPKHPFALALVIQRVLPESFRQTISRCRRYRGDAEVGPNTLAERTSALPPLRLRRGCFCLVKARNEHSSCNRVRTERIE